MSIRDDFDAHVRSSIGHCYDIGYTPTRFEQMINASHPVEVGKQLVISGDFQHGICELAKLGRLELTIESLMLQTQFSGLFTQEELSAAAWRLNNVPTTT